MSHSNRTGQIVLLKDGDNNGKMFLLTGDRRTFPISTVSVLSDQYAENNMSVNFPKPWIYKLEDGKAVLVEQGAKLKISLDEYGENPLVEGCINSLGNQLSVEAGFRIDTETLDEVRNFKSTENFRYEETISQFGSKSFVITNGSFSISVNGEGSSVSLFSENAISLEADEIARLLAPIVEVGGNYSRENDTDVTKSRGKEVNLNSEVVNIGYSPERFPDLKIDNKNASSAIDNPKLQPLLMGYAMINLVKKALQIIYDADYIGPNGPVQMSVEDKLQLQTDVIDKLEKALSSVGFIIKDKSVKSS